MIGKIVDNVPASATMEKKTVHNEARDLAEELTKGKAVQLTKDEYTKHGLKVKWHLLHHENREGRPDWYNPLVYKEGDTVYLKASKMTAEEVEKRKKYLKAANEANLRAKAKKK